MKTPLPLLPCFALVFSVSLLSSGCGGPAEPTDGAQLTTARAAASLQVGSVHTGYRHALSRSKFPIQANRSVSEFGFNKTVGPSGTFAVSAANGSVLAVLNADAPELQAGPSLLSADEHNARVRDYFVGAGIPSNQIGSVSALPEIGGVGEISTLPQNFELLGYISVLNRSIEG